MKITLYSVTNAANCRLWK